MTMGLEIEAAGEEDLDLPQRVRDKLKWIPEQVKREVRGAHQAVGHMNRDALLRMAKKAGRSEGHRSTSRLSSWGR